jgi:DNA invertase Pin-like site-specific DNA recombinase
VRSKVMRVAIYTRVSTNAQSYDRQVEELTEWATNRGDEIVAVFSEKASGAKNDRAERAKVLDLAKKRKIDVVLVSELSRWGRSTIDVMETVQELAACRVSLKALSGMDFDMSTPQGKLFVTMLGGFAEFEKNLIVERVKSGIAHKRSTTETWGRKAKASNAEIEAALLAGNGIRPTAEALGVSTTTVLKVSRRLKESMSA